MIQRIFARSIQRVTFTGWTVEIDQIQCIEIRRSWLAAYQRHQNWRVHTDLNFGMNMSKNSSMEKLTLRLLLKRIFQDCDWSIEINLTRKSISFSFDATNSNQDVSRPAVAVIESHIIQNVQTGMWVQSLTLAENIPPSSWNSAFFSHRTDDATVTPLLLTLNEAPCVSIEDVQTWLNDERQVKVQLRCTAEAFAELTATLNEWVTISIHLC